MAAGGLVTDQLVLFADPKPTGNGRGGSIAHGPRGLLRALTERGLAEDALEVAAALVLVLDAEPIGEAE